MFNATLHFSLYVREFMSQVRNSESRKFLDAVMLCRCMLLYNVLTLNYCNSFFFLFVESQKVCLFSLFVQIDKVVFKFNSGKEALL